MTKQKRFLSILLAVCMLASLFTSFASASSQEQAIAEPDAFELPDIIEPAEAEENCYVGRLRDAENDLNTFVFAGSDGTNTMRVYSHPVKYIADDGSVRDISLDIKARLGGGFISADHEIITTFKRKLSDGISLTYNDIAVRLVPQISAGTQPLASLSSDSKKVTYQMSDITSLVYELTYAGFKEDIVVEEYTGQTEYEFTLYTNGLTLCQEYGSYYLADADGKVEATIGDIIVFTADERNNTMGSMTYETVRANQEYILTIHLDAAYLADEDTVYPIRIDPTIEINYDNNGAGAIEDVTISPTQTFSGTSGALNIGRIPSGGISRALMRFPNLSLSGISPTQITAASVELRDLMCQGDEDITVECRIYNNSAPSWSESGTTTWSSVGTSYLGALLDSHVISYGEGNVDGEQHRYSFSILSAAKAWASGTQSQAKGLVFKANDAFENQTGDDVKSWYKIFASYNRNNYKPSLSITYDIYSGGEGFADAETLTLDSLRYVNIITADAKKYFKFIPSTTGFYTFESSDIASGDPRAWLYNSDYTVLSSNDDGAGSSNFRLTYHLAAGYTYYFVAGCIVSSPTICTVKVTTTTVPSSISTTSLSWGDSRVASCNAKNKAVFYKFIPSQSGEYMFFSTASSGDPKIWLYNSSLSLVSSNDDGAGNYNFRLSASLVSGQTYYIVAGECGAKTGSYYHYLSKATSMSTSVNHLRNVGTLKYMDIDGPDAQEWVHQWSAHTDLQEKWTLQRQSDGYYTIRSQYDKKYYVGISSTSIGVNNIKLYSGVADNTKWKIYELSSGVFLLEPKTAPGKILYAPSTGTGAKLQLSNLSASVSERNRWNVLKNALSYVNYYDSSFGSNSILQSYVTKANEFSDFVFTKYFGVGMYIDGSPSQYATVLDDCSTGTNTCCTTATCGSKCNYGHHKNIFTISNQLYNDDREDNHLYVLWTNREYGKAYCCEQNGRHTSYTAIALVCNKWPVIHFLNIYGSNNSRQLACMAMNIVHETAHTMGMPDVYNNIGHDVSGTKCLMEKFDETTAYAFYQDVLNGIEDPFCPSCMQTMETYTSNVYLPGN